MQQVFDQITQLVASYVPNLLGALAILILGWLLALIIAAIFRGILRKSSLDKKLAKWIGGEDRVEEIPVARYVGKTVFYVVLLFVLVAFFQALGLTIITEPLNQLLTQVFVFAPQILAAVLLLFLAWILASFLRMIITRLLDAVKLDEKLIEKSGMKAEERIPLSKTIGNAVYWIIFLLFLPAILGSLQLQGLMGPVQGMVDEILKFLPNIFTAGLIIVVGWFVASIIKRVLSNVLAAIGLDRLSEKVGLAKVLGKKKLSEVLGFVVYVLILIPIIISALEALSLEAITAPATNMLNMILSALPSIFAAALIVTVSYVVGKVISNLVANLLDNIGFNQLWMKLGLTKEEKEKKKASDFIGYLVLLAILFFASIEALRMLNFENVAELVSQFVGFAGQILIGLVILAIGLFLANLVSQKIKESSVTQATLLALLAKVAILILAGAMALQQMGFGEDIIILAFGFSIGAIAIAAAIAFGIGGKDIAAEQLREWTKQLKS